MLNTFMISMSLFSYKCSSKQCTGEDCEEYKEEYKEALQNNSSEKYEQQADCKNGNCATAQCTGNECNNKDECPNGECENLCENGDCATTKKCTGDQCNVDDETVFLFDFEAQQTNLKEMAKYVDMIYNQIVKTCEFKKIPYQVAIFTIVSKNDFDQFNTHNFDFRRLQESILIITGMKIGEYSIKSKKNLDNLFNESGPNKEKANLAYEKIQFLNSIERSVMNQENKEKFQLILESFDNKYSETTNINGVEFNSLSDILQDKNKEAAYILLAYHTVLKPISEWGNLLFKKLEEKSVLKTLNQNNLQDNINDLDQFILKKDQLYDKILKFGHQSIGPDIELFTKPQKESMDPTYTSISKDVFLSYLAKQLYKLYVMEQKMLSFIVDKLPFLTETYQYQEMLELILEIQKIIEQPSVRYAYLVNKNELLNTKVEIIVNNFINDSKEYKTQNYNKNNSKKQY